MIPSSFSTDSFLSSQCYPQFPTQNGYVTHIYILFKITIQHGFPKPRDESIINHTFKNGDKNIPSNYKTIMTSPLLTNLYITIFGKQDYLMVRKSQKKDKRPRWF